MLVSKRRHGMLIKLKVMCKLQTVDSQYYDISMALLFLIMKFCGGAKMQVAGYRSLTRK